MLWQYAASEKNRAVVIGLTDDRVISAQHRRDHHCLVKKILSLNFTETLPRKVTCSICVLVFCAPSTILENAERSTVVLNAI